MSTVTSSIEIFLLAILCCKNGSFCQTLNNATFHKRGKISGSCCEPSPNGMDCGNIAKKTSTGPQRSNCWHTYTHIHAHTVSRLTHNPPDRHTHTHLPTCTELGSKVYRLQYIGLHNMYSCTRLNQTEVGVYIEELDVETLGIDS